MRALFMSPTFLLSWGGGTAIHVLRNKDALEHAGYFVDLITEKPTELEGWEDNQIFMNDEYDELKFTNSRFSDCLNRVELLYPISRKFVSALRTRVYDFVYITDPCLLPIYYSILSYGKKIPLILHTFLGQIFLDSTSSGSGTINSQTDMIKALIYHQNPAIKISVSSPHMKRLFYKKYDRKAIILPPPMRDLPKRKKFEKTKGLIWSCSAWKGGDVAVKVIKEVRRLSPKMPITFHVYGADNQVEATRKKVEKYVTTFIAGGLEWDHLMKLFSEHRFGLYTSTVDMFPQALIEHLNYHPTFVSTIDLKFNYVEEGVGIKFKSIKKVARKIVASYDNKQEWEKKRKAGIKIVDSLEKIFLGTLKKLTHINKTNKTETRIVTETALILEHKNKAPFRDILKQLGWGDILSAHTTVPYLKAYFKKFDCEHGTCYSYKNNPCKTCDKDFGEFKIHKLFK